MTTLEAFAWFTSALGLMFAGIALVWWQVRP